MSVQETKWKAQLSEFLYYLLRTESLVWSLVSLLLLVYYFKYLLSFTALHVHFQRNSYCERKLSISWFWSFVVKAFTELCNGGLLLLRIHEIKGACRQSPKSTKVLLLIQVVGTTNNNLTCSWSFGIRNDLYERQRPLDYAYYKKIKLCIIHWVLSFN